MASACTPLGGNPTSATFDVSSLSGTVNSKLSTVLPSSFSVTVGTVSTASVTVNLLDNSGAPVSGELVTLYSDIQSNAGTITPAEATSDANGVATFSVSSTLAGTAVYYAIAGPSSELKAVGQTASIVYTAGPATTLMVTNFPLATNSGVSHSALVTAYDMYGNQDSNYNNSVQLTSSDPQVNPQSNSLSSGIGVFNVTLMTDGTQSITATDTVNSSITGTLSGIVVSN